MSYKFSKKAAIHALLPVLLLSSVPMLATTVRAQNVLDILRQVAPPSVRQYIPQSSSGSDRIPTNSSNPSVVPSSNTISKTQSQDLNTKRNYVGTGFSSRETYQVMGVSAPANASNYKPYVEYKLVGCSKIPNSKNVGMKQPRVRNVLYKELGSIVCNFSIVSNFDGFMEIKGSPSKFISESSAIDFRGNKVNMDTMVVNGDMEHNTLPVKFTKNTPFALTTYLTYELPSKQVTPFRSLTMTFDLEGDGALKGKILRDQSLSFENVNVNE
jgi:hypothetical protein